MTDLDAKIDEIVLKPAQWRLDDYQKARQDIKQLILQEREQAVEKYKLKQHYNNSFRQTLTEVCVCSAHPAHVFCLTEKIPGCNCYLRQKKEAA